MKNSLRVLAALGLCNLLGGLASAAPQAAPPAGKMGGPGQMGGRLGGPGGMRRGGGMGMRRMERMAKEMGLTDAQKAKVKTIMEAQRPQMMALRSNTSLSDDQRRAKMRTMMTAQNKKIAAVLTPAQRKKMETMMKERRGRGGGPMGGPRAAKA